MSNVVIKVDTGFAGAIHTYKTNITPEEWDVLTNDEKLGWLVEATDNFVEVYAETEDGELL